MQESNTWRVEWYSKWGLNPNKQFDKFTELAWHPQMSKNGIFQQLLFDRLV
jgi:hypothetical protein